MTGLDLLWMEYGLLPVAFFADLLILPLGLCWIRRWRRVRATDRRDHAKESDRGDLRRGPSRGSDRERPAPKDVQVGRGELSEDALSLGRMATVETGDEHLDALAHAVAIDHLRKSGPEPYADVPGAGQRGC